MVKKIIELLGKLPTSIQEDIGLYVALGLTAVVFLAALIAALASSGELGKFKSRVAMIQRDTSPKNVNANMQLMPVKVKKLYKRAMMTGAKPSDIINVDAAVIAPFSRSAMKKLPAAAAIGAVVAICAGVGLDLAYHGEVTASSGVIVLTAGLLGGLLVLVSSMIAGGAFKGAMKSYDSLMETLDGIRAHADSAPAPEPAPEEGPVIHSKSDFEGKSRITVEIEEEEQAPVRQAEPEPQFAQGDYKTYEPSVEEPPVYEPPVQQPQYQQAEAVIVEPDPVSEAELKARAREEALAAARAEQAERMKAQQAAAAARPAAQNPGAARTAAQQQQQNAARAAAQQRLEALKAQREAQLKAQQSRAQTAAPKAQPAQGAGPSVSTEDVIARIEQIGREGAPLPVMKEVALLLQQERAKPENKTPEQQKKLNEALSKLLKAMSSAGKK